MITNFEALTLHTPGYLTCRGALYSAVLVPLIKTEHGYDMLFEVRAGTIADQPGDTCFPGGRTESGETARETALREACEELLISREQINILGMLDVYATPSFVVTPFVGEISGYKDTYSRDEVSRIIRVPLDDVLTARPEYYKIIWESERPDDFPYDRIVGGKNYRWRQMCEDQFFYSFGSETVWGLTARIMHNFTSIMGVED